MCWHFTVGFAPFLVGIYATTRHTPFDKIIATTPLFLPFAGTFCVYIFFVLSGFVLSLSYFKHKDVGVLISSATRRYIRLMVPALGSTILAFLVMSFIGYKAHIITGATTQSSWMQLLWVFHPHFFDAIYQGTYGIFFSNQNSYNPNLWTMQYELTGSFLIFAFLAFFGKLPRRWVLYIAVSFIFLKTPYLAFILGVAICDIWTNTLAIRGYITDRIAWILLPIGLFLGSWNLPYNIYHPFYASLHLYSFTGAQTLLLAQIIGAVCVIISVLQLRTLTKFFETRLLQYLGRISFSLYLLHWIILYSISAYIFNQLLPHVGYTGAILLMLAISLPLIFVASTLYTKYVDTKAIVWSKSVSSWLLTLKKSKTAVSQIPAVKETTPLLPTVD
jgi:peptidoglycan/LPS O-acetylase OafA/YrhL